MEIRGGLKNRSTASKTRKETDIEGYMIHSTVQIVIPYFKPKDIYE